jgi:hypothetical protein
LKDCSTKNPRTQEFEEKWDGIKLKKGISGYSIRRNEGILYESLKLIFAVLFVIYAAGQGDRRMEFIQIQYRQVRFDRFIASRTGKWTKNIPDPVGFSGLFLGISVVLIGLEL